ncbi:MAG: tRNA (guanosine(37)-N1)-methyltransferase TrmD [bacterium]
MLTIHIITIFPNMFTSVFAESIVKRAKDKDLIAIKIYNLRDWTDDARKTVDDKPYGGGPGMVMKVEPFYKAVKEIKANLSGNIKVILTSAKGKQYNQQIAQEYSQLDHLIILCGHYEGVDERVSALLCDTEISVGNYILTGGEIPAMTIADSVVRLIPGVLGNEESLDDESHNEENKLEYPQYTRPEVFTDSQGEAHSVPSVLTNGNHKEIQTWRQTKK